MANMPHLILNYLKKVIIKFFKSKNSVFILYNQFGVNDLSHILRQPFSLFGALTLIGLFKGLLTLQEDLLYVVSAIQSITHPIWEFLFFWVKDYLNLTMPNYVKDYATMGLIVYGAGIRRNKIQKEVLEKYFSKDERNENLFIKIAEAFIVMLLWPIAFWGAYKRLHQSKFDLENHIKTRLKNNEFERNDILYNIKYRNGYKDWFIKKSNWDSTKPINENTLCAYFKVSYMNEADILSHASIVFFEFIIWTIILLIINYTLLSLI